VTFLSGLVGGRPNSDDHRDEHDTDTCQGNARPGHNHLPPADDLIVTEKLPDQPIIVDDFLV
jgi:hypothetical protein